MIGPVGTDAEPGRVEGRDYVFHHSGVYYGGDTQAALDSVIAARPDLILAMNLGFAIAAHKATKTIPIVMWISGFPVEAGVADSLARPGKNVTGMTVYAGGEVFGKLVQLVQESKPGIRRVGRRGAADTQAMWAAAHRRYRPFAVMVPADPSARATSATASTISMETSLS